MASEFNKGLAIGLLGYFVFSILAGPLGAFLKWLIIGIAGYLYFFSK